METTEGSMRGFTSNGTLPNVKGIKPLVECKEASATKDARATATAHSPHLFCLSPAATSLFLAENRANDCCYHEANPTRCLLSACYRNPSPIFNMKVSRLYAG